MFKGLENDENVNNDTNVSNMLIKDRKREITIIVILSKSRKYGAGNRT